MPEVSPRAFSTEFKVGLLPRLQAGVSVAALSREYGIAPQLIYDWRKFYRAYGTAGLNRKHGRRSGWRFPPSRASRSPRRRIPAPQERGMRWFEPRYG